MQVKQRCDPRPRTSWLDILFAFEKKKQINREGDKENLHVMFTGAPSKARPHCAAVAPSICLHHSVKRRSQNLITSGDLLFLLFFLHSKYNSSS